MLKTTRRQMLASAAAIGAATGVLALAQNMQYLKPLAEFVNTRLQYPDRSWEEMYRRRWQYDKVARSTHGVNCTGSCSWNVYVKDGLIVWELQATDYPDISPDIPNYEPRGCPRGASFSWYVYSPLRVKYPYVRGVLINMYRKFKQETGDPVEAWRRIVEDPANRAAYQKVRGKAGWARVTWDEALELISAALIYTIKKYGPDRIYGFTPIPAMSPVSYAAGARFIELIGGAMGSFYDWYADLPPASPQMWGEQTDVPESADWYHAQYMIVWGTNLPMTRTPDAPMYTQARYRGAKVAVVSPDYSEHVKFADVWIPASPGTDAALGLAMAHVALKESYVDTQFKCLREYARRYTDMPFLVTLEPAGDGTYLQGRFLRASDVPELKDKVGANPEWKTVVLQRDGTLAAPYGSIGFRWDGSGKWNLELKGITAKGEGDIDPVLSVMEVGQYEKVPVKFFAMDFDVKAVVREVPAVKVGGRYVTTVFDLLAAHLGVKRGDLGGDYPADYNDPKPFTPAWQEAITGVSRDLAIQVARDFMNTAVYSKPVYGKPQDPPFFGDEATPCGGRAMIFVGPGINHWYHADLIYRSVLLLVLLGATQGKNGGGWAHYVGQEKIRTLIGWASIAFALDWVRPPRRQNSPSYWYVHTDQWRYDPVTTKLYAAPWAKKWGDLHEMDANVIAARLGWLPFYPSLNVNPLDLGKRLVDEAKAQGVADAQLGAYVARRVADMLKAGEIKMAIEDPDAPENWPRVLFVWRANLLGSSSKGHEYFLKHLLGTDNNVMNREVAVENKLVKEVNIRPAPEGKLDLLVVLDFRMATSAVYADVVLPAATWYEKYDLSMTDMHTFIHPFTPAVDPPWEAKSDWDIFRELAKKFSEMARRYLPEEAYDVVLTPLLHDTAQEIAQPMGEVKDWKKGEVDPIPGKTMPAVALVKRRYWDVYDMYTTYGPLVVTVGLTAKGIPPFKPVEQYAYLRERNGVTKATSTYVLNQCKAVGGCPTLERDKHAAETMLAVSPESNGEVAYMAWKNLERVVGLQLADLPAKELRITFNDIVAQPRRVTTSPVWNGVEAPGRTYSPFTVNTERRVPWRTLTGRQHFYIDHEWFRELGESLPVHKRPLDQAMARLLVDVSMGDFWYDPAKYRVESGGSRYLVARYLTPHGKWNIHSEYWDNLIMLTLFRGGQVVWMNDEDAKWLGVRDNDWIEVYNANGVIVARAAVSPRIPRGTVIMYHAQERHVYVPISPKTGRRAGIHNSVTITHLKPTKMVGGYAQLSWDFNYYGPTGVNRDTLVVIRPAGRVRL
ncbi:nitrate reductase subunit alpha [Pyrobaculum ferrireducens]|uniref:nitrate reductase (quinone) n=1 Tax=Pyrobaculum ferrireducens TaxID=1104324 RepID=G7VAI4_9CREN|nr:nitrate reductase subunit alpha [Pyrobaculum ferrireducens]AET32223.1 nitrate reductase alpha subunit (narG) [Pyrobaculum ferrireducens]